MKNVLLLNDTSNEMHVGSTSISSFIKKKYSGDFLTAYKFVGGRYVSDMKRLKNYDLLVVNAEGTLSRCTDRSRKLCDLIEGVAAKKKVMLNADLCIPVCERLKSVCFDVVHYRRRHDLCGLTSKKSIYLPDLFYYLVKEMYSPAKVSQKKRSSYYVLGDSHKYEDFQYIYDYSKKLDMSCFHLSMNVLAIPQLDYKLNALDVVKAKFWLASRNNLAAWRKRNAVGDINEWLRIIAESKFLLTGRFHQVVAAMALNIPCLYYESSTTKISALRDYFGINKIYSIMDKDFDVLPSFSDLDSGESFDYQELLESF